MSNFTYSVFAIPDTVLNGTKSYRVKLPRLQYVYPISITVVERNGRFYHYVQMKIAYKSHKCYIGKAGEITIGDVISAIDRLRSRTGHDPGAYLV